MIFYFTEQVFDYIIDLSLLWICKGGISLKKGNYVIPKDKLAFEQAIKQELIKNISDMLPECSLDFLTYLNGFVYNGKQVWDK